MIGPEPDQPLGESDLGAERRFDTGLHLVEIESSPRIRHDLRGGLLRYRAGVLRSRLRHGGRSRHLLFLRRVLLLLRDDRPRLPLRVGFVDDAVSLGARRQRGGGGQVNRRPLEFGEQGAARIARDGRDRSRPRPHPEPIKRQRCFSLCGTAHDHAPKEMPNRDANAPATTGHAQPPKNDDVL